MQTNNCKPDHAQFGINPETGDRYSGKTALHFAFERGHEKIGQILIDSGWSPKALDDQGFTPEQLFAKGRRPGAANKCRQTFQTLGLRERLLELRNNREGAIKILSLGCGIAPEFLALDEIFKEDKFIFHGVDIVDDSKLFEEDLKKDNFNFIKADLTDEPTRLRLQKNGPYDIVFLMHPNILFQRHAFEVIAVFACKMLDEKSMLWLSTFHLVEYTEVENVFFKHRPNLQRLVQCAIELNCPKNKAIFCNLSGLYILKE